MPRLKFKNPTTDLQDELEQLVKALYRCRTDEYGKTSSYTRAGIAKLFMISSYRVDQLLAAESKTTRLPDDRQDYPTRTSVIKAASNWASEPRQLKT